MSYQFELPRVTRVHLADAVRVKAEDWLAKTSLAEEERDAVTGHIAGITYAIDILQSWMGNDDDQEVRCVVTGHANPGHLPREGYSDEHITISIGVLPTTEVGAVAADPMYLAIADAVATPVKGVVRDAGGGEVAVVVDRETVEYPAVGAQVSVETADPSAPVS